MPLKRTMIACGLAPALLVGLAHSAEETAAERGRKALLGRAFSPPTISLPAYENAWRQWGDGAKQPPYDYAEAFRRRYGLHPAPYPNDGYPMGLRPGNWLLGKGLSYDCLLCHGGSIAGQSHVGLGNSALDFQALTEDLAAAAGRRRQTPFVFSNVRGTSEAGPMAVFLLSWREPDLKLRRTSLDLKLRDDLCEDVPAWWLLKKKKTMYHTGYADARSVRSLMQFMLTPNNSPDAIKKEEATFRDIQAYILTLEAPKYPLAVDADLADKGAGLFRAHCSRCHGTYGAHPTYPNKQVPLAEIGTDPSRYFGFSKESGQYYNQSWFAQEKPGWLADDFATRASPGYQAPPLDGIWASAPYFHNGAAPTVYHVLNSKARPRFFTRSFRTDLEAYDPVKLGWKVKVLNQGADPALSPFERRQIYDTTLPGRGNGGHTFADDLTDEDRFAVIEYLKTI